MTSTPGITTPQTIVIGVTNHTTALAACERGLALARISDATVHLVYAIDENDPHFEVKRDRHAEGLLESISKSSGRPVQTHALVGKPHEVILSVARSTNADLLVIGNQGLTRRGRFTRQTPARVLRSATCSVLVVDTSSAKTTP